MSVKEESEKVGLKLNINNNNNTHTHTHKTPKIIASGSIPSWQIEEEKVEAVEDFLFLVSKITVDGDSSLEM